MKAFSFAFRYYKKAMKVQVLMMTDTAMVLSILLALSLVVELLKFIRG